MGEKPSPAHDAPLKAPTELARPAGAPAGAYVAVIRSGGLDVPVVGSVGGPSALLMDSMQDRLQLAREALRVAEHRRR